jgi:hypothetical protein
MRGYVTVAIVAFSALAPEPVPAQSPANPTAPPFVSGSPPPSGSQPEIAQDRANALRRGPADLCQEVLAFVRLQSPVAGAATQPTPQTATAVQAPAQAAPAPLPGGGPTQQTSGMSAPITPSGPGASGPQGAAQGSPASPPSEHNAAPASAPGQASAPQSSQASTQGARPPAQSAPEPATSTAPPPLKPSLAQIEKVEAAARDHNLQNCRDAAQEMRRAGITMPAALLALAALNLKFFEVGQNR